MRQPNLYLFNQVDRNLAMDVFSSQFIETCTIHATSSSQYHGAIYNYSISHSIQLAML